MCGRSPRTLDLVVIGSPSGTHAALADAALDAGLDVVVDKPFAVTADGGQRADREGGRLGRRITVFQNRRWDGDFLTVPRAPRRRARSARCGASSRASSGGSPSPSPLEDRARRRAEARRHPLRPRDAPDRPGRAAVRPRVERARRDRPSPTGAAADDDSFIALQHVSGVTSHLWMSAVAPLAGPRFHVLGSRAGYTTWGLDPQEPSLLAGRCPASAASARCLRIAGACSAPTAPRVACRRSAATTASSTGCWPVALRGGGPLPVDPARRRRRGARAHRARARRRASASTV